MVTLSVQNGTIICPVYYLGLGDDAAILVMLFTDDPGFYELSYCPGSTSTLSSVTESSGLSDFVYRVAKVSTWTLN